MSNGDYSYGIGVENIFSDDADSREEAFSKAREKIEDIDKLDLKVLEKA